MPLSIRLLTDADLARANAILQSAFQRSESWLADLQLFQKLQPNGVCLACQNEIPLGMVAAIKYPTFAYVGLMGVRWESQRQGIGLALMQHILAWLDRERVRQVVLDASPLGQPLYEKLGFVAGEEVYILQRQTGGLTFQCPAKVHPLSLQNLDLITAFDKRAFGADRSGLLQALLETYPQRAFLLNDGQGGISGYVIAQEKRIGPWVMENAATAEFLLKAALSLPFDGKVSVVVPGENMDALDLLQRYAFKTVRVNRHMTRGSDMPASRREKIFAQASLSFG
jgi:predicted N-acetyltransferase YhbS